MEKFILYWILATSLLLGCSIITASMEGEMCIQESNCDGWGIQCGACVKSGQGYPRCTRLIPNHPYLRFRGAEYNRYSWLTTRRSFARTGMKSPTGSLILAPTSQEDSITEQLKNGIRGLMLDVHDYNDTIWLCYLACTDFTAFEPAINVLNEVRMFLDSNPHDVITIFLEDSVTSPNGLTKLFGAAGLKKFWFPLAQMPKQGRNWPKLDDMIRLNHRLVVFTSTPDKEKSEQIAYKWNYLVENQYGNGYYGMQNASCLKRTPSSPLNSSFFTLILINHFRSIPDLTQSCKDNSDLLISKVQDCSVAASGRWPNFIAVDFYKRSEGGEVAKAVDMANGKFICGCESIALCKPHMKFGDCDKT